MKQGKTVAGVTAVEPYIRWHGYHARSRRALQRWTIDRMRADRPRYRLGADLGCGNGEWTELFAPWCDELHACDVSPDFVAQVRARTSWHRNVVVEASDLRSFTIPEGADFVYFGATFMYLQDRDVLEVLKHVVARTAPNAHVIIRDYCTFNLGLRTEYPTQGHSIHRSAGDLLRIASDAGLRCDEVRSSFSIYGELGAWGVPGLQWPFRALLRFATIPWTRASHTLRFHKP
ncbi:MAG: class I SAM-dependent methyltransferase [Kofleriaceae bacterium]